jgi:hypothetical protein
LISPLTSASFFHRKDVGCTPDARTSAASSFLGIGTTGKLHLPLSFNDDTSSSCLSQSSKVAVLGAAGGIGQPLSLLMKLNPRVSQLALYDIRMGPGTHWNYSPIDENILIHLSI